ncbi:MAG: hypothetical protein KAI81_07520, partial [Candidatus Marinimicrobia bacterium]|nr:hypothetical protein [Candidatus Neomarinimicrobiota bacterium]
SKFRPDYDNHDYVNFVDSDGDGIKDLIVIYDINNAADQVWNLTADKDPLGMVGLRIYDTPHDMGVTNFHHFANEVKPGTDEEIWAIMTSDTASSALKNSDFYFHGENYRIDNTDEDNRGLYYPATTYEETDPPYSAELEGDAVNTIWSVGPFSLKADSSVTLSVGLIMGDAGDIPMQPDFTDLMSNVAIANSMHELFFQGSGPPEAPKVYAVAGDKKAILYWDSDPSESSVDAMTGEKDFEGYKIFRSTDMGETWGDPITNVYGEIVGYTPLATFDLINDIEGIDPAFPQHLGTNTGLVHTFIDSNLMNGLEYWYCISSYDKGRNVMDGDEQILEQSYIYPLGSSIFENHTVSVIPGIIANNITEATAPVGNLIPTNGITDGIVNIEIMDPDKITGHDYEITISEDALKISETGDTSYVMGFNLVNKTRGDTLLLNHLFSDATEDNIPVVDGFRLKIQNSKTGISSIGWTKVAGDTCTFDWRWHNKYSGADIVPPEISTFDDWRITVDYNTGFEAQWFDYFSGTVQESKQHMPLKIEIITDQENPIDASEDTWLYEFAINASWATYRIGYYSKLGWDLVPGGLGYNAAMTGFYEKYPDVIVLEKIQTEAATGDTIPNYMYLFTNNKPDTSYNKEGEMEIIDAKAPSDGDEFT